MNEPTTLIRIAVGGERALSQARSAVNIRVTAAERAFIDRLNKLFFTIGNGLSFCNDCAGLQVQDLEEADA